MEPKKKKPVLRVVCAIFFITYLAFLAFLGILAFYPEGAQRIIDFFRGDLFALFFYKPP